MNFLLFKPSTSILQISIELVAILNFTKSVICVIANFHTLGWDFTHFAPVHPARKSFIHRFHHLIIVEVLLQ